MKKHINFGYVRKMLKNLQIKKKIIQYGNT